MSPSKIRGTRKIFGFRFYVLILFSIIENLQIQIFSEFRSVDKKCLLTRLNSTFEIIRKNEGYKDEYFSITKS